MPRQSMETTQVSGDVGGGGLAAAALSAERQSSSPAISIVLQARGESGFNAAETKGNRKGMALMYGSCCSTSEE